MHTKNRRASSAQQTLSLLGLLATLIVVALPAAAQQNNDVVWMGGCNGPMVAGSCPVYTQESTRLTIRSFSTGGSFLRSDQDSIYFDNPYDDANISVTAQVVSGPSLDLVRVSSPPGPGQYQLNWTTSQVSRQTHQINLRAGKGRHWVLIGENYRSGPGLTIYDVTVRVSRRVPPITLPPLFQANNCQPPAQLGTLSPGGGVQNLRYRGRIQVRPGSIDCYEFSVNRPASPFTGWNPFTLGLGTLVNFNLTGLPNTGTKFLYLLDMDRGRFVVLRNTSATAIQHLANLPNGRYRMYVIVGRDAVTSSQYSFSLGTR